MAMIKVTAGNNMNRRSTIVDENTTLRQFLEENQIDYTRGMTTLDGCSLQPGDIDRTFASFGIAESCFLLNVVKADNAAIKVTAGNNMNRRSVIVDENVTLRNFLEENQIDYTRGMTTLDGSSLQSGDIDRTFASFGITESCFLLNVVKADNAK